MKLAIYGDSFADPSYADPEIQTASWPGLLSHDYHLDNYALMGSSLYWSMQEFERTHEAYDRVVFVVTSAGRWPGVITAEDIDPRPLAVSSYDQALRIKSLLENSKTLANLSQQTAVIRQVDDIAAWFLGDARHWQFELYVHRLMISEILRLRPDAVVIPINSAECTLGGLAADTLSLTDFVCRSLEWFYPHRPKDLNPWPELTANWLEQRIACHMTPETNRVVYSAVTQALAQSKWQLQMPKEIAHDHPWDYYYKRR
jgi:hypothetical protein